ANMRINANLQINKIRGIRMHSRIRIGGAIRRFAYISGFASGADSRRGFIALMSAIIISVVLLLIITTTGLTGFFGRFNILDSEYKERSSALADACVDKMILKLADDSSYSGEASPISVGSEPSDVCSVLTGATGDPIRTFKIQASYQNAYTNLQVAVNIDTFEITSWEEWPNLP
ncbi:MAG: hypothetical protein Q7S28_02745, partial [bacterium]|nr:hypothetical protein [bacterium]